MVAQTSQRSPLAYFTNENAKPFEDVNWEVRDAVITGRDGEIVFEARGVEFPSFWSQRTTDIVASKYFRMVGGKREHSVRQIIERVAGSITRWGELDGYFAGQDSEQFYRELVHILLHQYAAFNSPVWFNVGVADVPQTSACYILDVDDSVESILEWCRQEALIFKGGSGAGTNLSKLRHKNAPLSNGGTASGPVSFMRVGDTVGGVMKSGGGTRRAAKMIILNADHPDIREFIWCKVLAERMAKTLAQAGHKDGLEEEVRDFIPFQNANNSVSVVDAFMEQAYTSRDSPEHALLLEIAQAAWECGDPNLFFYSQINTWHTTPSRGPIVSSNPCSEFLRPPDESCNLASLNLLKFLKADNSFDIPAFEHTTCIMTTALDILIDRSSYPTEAIRQNSRDFRPLGLGYANLGALLMAKGLPYNSDEGRSYAASVTSLITGRAYAQSGRLAEVKGAFAGFLANGHDMQRVIGMHRHHAYNQGEAPLNIAAMHAWDEAYAAVLCSGFRNCQVSVLAPVGTIGFMMDVDTTGIEPCLGLITHKKLIGGGEISMVNGVVHRALETLGYEAAEAEKLCAAIYDGKPFAGRTEHDAVFATALGDNTISWQGHVKMVAAVQPFISGGISKTINMPAESTVQDIYDAYVMSWQLGLKSVAVYRDGCKNVQPVTVTKIDTRPQFMPEHFLVRPEYEERARAILNTKLPETPRAQRTRLPDDRSSLTHKFSIAGHEGYMTVGLYPDGQPGELFLRMAKEGSTVSGLMDTIGILTSLCLQHGVPLKTLTDKLCGTHFEPAGVTGNKRIRFAKSVVDYVFRWLSGKFVPVSQTELERSTALWHNEVTWALDPAVADAQPVGMTGEGRLIETDAPACAECGQLMTRRTGSCFVCDVCGSSAGCS